MFIKSLALKNFRNHCEIFFEFDSKVNVIFGANAQGKTNILESICFLMAGRSFRNCPSKDLIQWNKDYFLIEAIFCKHGVDQKLNVSLSLTEKRIVHNQTHLQSFSHLLGIIPGIVMTPDDVNIINGSPSLRRTMLDLQLVQSDPLYVHFLTRYQKAMRHRNSLLKGRKRTGIEIWEQEMAHAAGYLTQQRRKNVAALQEYCRQYYSHLTEEIDLFSIKYLSSAIEIDSESEIRKFYQVQYEKKREREMVIGHTLSGPHRDDLVFNVGGKEAKLFASEGQRRSCVAAFFLSQWQILKESIGFPPLLMIDDAGISLDEKRRERLVHQFSSLGQVFLSTTDQQIVNSIPISKSIFPLGNHFSEFLQPKA